MRGKPRLDFRKTTKNDGAMPAEAFVDRCSYRPENEKII